MKVGYTVEQLWNRVPGGTAWAARRLAVAVGALESAPRVELVGLAALHRRPAPEPPPVPVRTVPLPRVALQELWHRLRRPRVERWAGPLDAVHATSPLLPAAAAPLVVTVHDLAWRHDPAHFTARGVRFFERSWAVTLDEAAAVAVPSEATAADCEAAGLDRSRLTVIPWGVDRGGGDGDRARRRHSLPERFVLFAGTLEPRKNVGRLVEALHRLGPGAPELVLTGSAGWGDGLAPTLATHPVAHRLLGHLERSDLADVYAAATVVAYPSIREGFGLPVLEAMAAGAPVLTSAGTSTEEVAGAAAVLVDPLDVDAIAGGLQQLLDDADLRRRLAAAGRERAEAFTWERCAAAHRALYQRVAGEQP